MNRRPRFARLAARRLTALCAGVALALPARSARRAQLPDHAASSAAPRSRWPRPACRCRELAPNAPDSHTVQSGDTLWDISKLFLQEPVALARAVGHEPGPDPQPAPDLPGPGAGAGKVRRPRAAARGPAGGRRRADQHRQAVAARAQRTLDNGAIASIPLHLIGPFLNEAVVFDTTNWTRRRASWPRRKAVCDVARRDGLRARRPQGPARLPPVPRSRAAARPDTGELLGYEARYVGTAEFVRAGGRATARTARRRDRAGHLLDDQHARMEAGVGDRLAPVPQRDYSRLRAARSGQRAMDGRIVSIYGEALRAGQNQIVALNRGARDGIERGHVLALWRDGESAGRSRPIRRAPLMQAAERAARACCSCSACSTAPRMR